MSLEGKQRYLDMESGDPTRIALHTDPTQKRLQGWTAHGGLRIDVPYISLVDKPWVEAPTYKKLAELYVGGCADGLILPENIDFVLSLYPWESYTINHDAEQIQVKMYDSVDQSFEQVDELAKLVYDKRAEGKNVLVHCQAGLNRSSLIAARSLMLIGVKADTAIGQIRDARSEACLCNPSFENWLRYQQ